MSSSMAPTSLMPVQTPTSAGNPAGPGVTAGQGATAVLEPGVAATGPPGTAGTGSDPPGGPHSPPTDGFASVLSNQVARTALAEGQKDKDKGTAPTKAGPHSRTSDKGAQAVDGSPPASPISPISPVSPASAVSPASPAELSAALPRAAAAAAKAQTPAGDDARTAAPAAAAAGASAAAHPGATLTPATATPTAAGAAAAIRSGAAGSQTGERSGDDKGSDPRQGSGDPTAPRTAAIKLAGPQAPSAAQAAKPATGKLAQAGATEVVARAHAAVATAPGTVGDGQAGRPTMLSAGPARPLSSAPPTAYGVRLEQAVEAMRTTIAMATRQGSSSARIQLSPESLGGLQIHLQKTPDGIVARVIADHASAAQTLAQNGDELRRSLASHGVTLLRLDVESNDRRDPQAQSQGGGGSSSSGSHAEAEDDATGATGSTVTQVSAHDLSGTALVNVLA
jgi:flagellar hook-length control protein FliK